MTIGEDDPITLQEACEMVFRGTVKVSTLRVEAERGNVEIFKVGRRHFTTLRSVRGMMDKCREKRKARGSISTASGNSGPSETDQVSSALVALSQTTRALKRNSRST
jgi:hypothetical protein